MAEQAGRLVTIKVSGTATNLSEEGLTHISDTVWQISTAAKQVIDNAVAPTLEKDDGFGGWDQITYSSVEYLSGKFTFSGAGHANTETIRVKTTSPTAKYLPMSTATYAHDFSYARGVDLIDVSKFLDTHKSRIPSLKYASGTISQWDVTDTYFADTLTAGEPVILEFRDAAASEPLRCWALLESAEMTAALGSAQDEVVTFISTDDLLNL